MKVLFASSEIFPHAKSGGLSDVSSALSETLAAEEGVELSRVMPRYSFIEKKKLKPFKRAEVFLGGTCHEVNFYKLEKSGVVTYFVDAPLLSETLGMYGEAGEDYSNNDLRFGIFAAAIVELARLLDVSLLHLNDWQCALAALFIKERELDIKTLFTIHNLAYQGVFEVGALSRLGIDSKHFHSDGLEFYGKVNFLKAGIGWCDALTSVSPSYAQEIQTPEYGCGLDGFVRLHAKKLTGILNGIDQNHFNPKKDKLIPFRYDANNLDAKHQNKTAFLKATPLKDPRKPLFVMISRLAEQKGLDLVLESLESLLAEKINLYVVGEGSASYKERLEANNGKYENFYFHNGYDEALSHQAYAAADFMLIPSRYEPCGLTQFIAMRYGAIPLVRSVGGLKDSVHEEEALCGRGIVFEPYAKEAFLEAFARALALKKNSKKYKAWQEQNMGCDFSFAQGAQEYLNLYKSLM
ncbi:MAG: glycogen/starch synthase [Thiovulaceae bacterium]|nr:glycogen/starch synthase [Sulfurimonadaceae bacterium]